MTKQILSLFTFLALMQVAHVQSQVPFKAEDISPLLIGEQVPNANLLDVDGLSVQLKDVMNVKPTILVFYRGGWCPYCNSQLSGLAEIEDEIEKLGYQIVAISPDHLDRLRSTTMTKIGRASCRERVKKKVESASVKKRR